MPIDNLTVANFKGIADKTTFEIKPLTLFIGPNSSGKSSCIHALAALAQTVKLSNSELPIVLDDEYAQVHLGRFIEVIHSKSYSDMIEIGVSINKSNSAYMLDKKTKFISEDDSISVFYSFKSTMRTQDISIDKAEFCAGTKSISYKKSLNNLGLKYNNKPLNLEAWQKSGLKIYISPRFTRDEEGDSINAFVLNEAIHERIASELRKTLYLGPFRQSPQRRYQTRGSTPLEVGAIGESAVTMLANEHVRSKTRRHIKEISTWMAELGLAKKVEVSRVGRSDLFDVKVTLNDNETLPIADLGYGVSQVLPVLVQCSFAQKGSVLLFEQPELHLHHDAARKLASVLARVAKEKDLRIIAETHSKDLFLQVLAELKTNELNLDDVVAYDVSRSESKSNFKKIVINVDGDGRYECEHHWYKGIAAE